ncbi:dispanin subfamily A member 2b [Microcaecilia unicolor]|uniref:Dispanin subfamily A member 2b-like n=1 Tax=Microcaecilia unicolor TaxID=1415580 RepID=A0A6P7XX00_9AMPH|nr:dispanin subfamily A member 2b-like [Microcaecilia unicolor]
MADYPTKADVPYDRLVQAYEQPKPGEAAPPYVTDINTVQVSVPFTPQPNDHVLWSLFNAMFLNVCCLGFLALVFSVKARDQKVLHDLDVARHYASTAKILNIICSVLGIITTIVLLIIVFISASHA